MTAQASRALVEKARLVPVVRAASPDLAKRAVSALRAGGITIFEVTLTVPNAVELIAELVQEYASDENVLVGAGTVVTMEDADRCLKAGSEFIVSPGTNLEMIRLCKERDIAIMPGALTPTEVIAAYSAGADMVKIFPCSAMGGAKYLKALRAPFPHIPLLPTGGVSQDNARDFLAAGANALGVGANLVDIQALEKEGPEALTRKAEAFLKAL